LTGVDLHNVALTDSPGTTSFYIDGHAGSLVGSLRGDRSASIRIDVTSARLSSYLVRLGEVIDAAKIDVEGAEWLILEDLKSASLLRRIQCYLVEFHHRIGDEPSRMAQFLAPFEAAGFDYSVRAQPRPPSPFQDVLIKFTQVDDPS